MSRNYFFLLAGLLLVTTLVLAADDPITVSSAARKSASPDLAIGPDGSINLIWVDKGANEPEDPHAVHKPGPPPGGHSHTAYNNLYFARSTDGGKTFSKPVRINTRDGELWGFATSKPRLAISKTGTIHIFYHANRHDESAKRQAVDARYTRSTDGGKTFAPPRTLNTQGGIGYDDGQLSEAHCFGTMGVAPNGDVHAYWIDTRHMKSDKDNGAIYGIVSRNDGKTFAPERAVFLNEACPCCQLGVTFAPDSKVYFSMRSVFADGARDGTVARSDDGGKTFSNRVRVSAQSWNIKACPLKPTTLTTDKDGRVFAVWFAGEMQPAGVYFARSEDGGKTFAHRQRLHAEARQSDHAQVTVGKNGDVFVVWDGRVGEVRRIYYRRSNDHGQTFGAVTELAAPPGMADYPVLGVGKTGQVVVAWQQNNRILLHALPQ
jgi:hypothetical protein